MGAMEKQLGHSALFRSSKMFLCSTLCASLLFSLVPHLLFSQVPNPPEATVPLDPVWLVIEKLINSGQLEKAREKLKEETTSRGHTHKSLYLEAQILFKENRFMESLQKIEGSLALEKRDPEPYKLAGLNWVVMERYDAARPFLETAVQLAPKDFMAHYYLGRLYYTVQRFPQAVVEFEKVVSFNPSFVRGHDNLGLALDALGKDEAASQSYRKAIELNEQQKLNYEWPYLNLGKFFLSRNLYQESLPLVQKAVELNPRSAEAYYVLGKLMSKLGNDMEALEALQQSSINDANFGEAHYLLSQIYRKRGQEEQAQKEILLFQEIKKSESKRNVADNQRYSMEKRDPR